MSLLRPAHFAFGAAAAAGLAIPWLVVMRAPDVTSPRLPVSARVGTVADPAEPALALGGRLFFGGAPDLAAASTDDGAATGVAVDAAPPPEPPRLVGTAVSRRGQAVAVIRSAAGDTRLLARGETIDGWRVLQIRDARVQIRLGGDTRTITIGSPAPPATTEPPAIASNSVPPRP